MLQLAKLAVVLLVTADMKPVQQFSRGCLQRHGAVLPSFCALDIVSRNQYLSRWPIAVGPEALAWLSTLILCDTERVGSLSRKNAIL